MTEPLLHQNSRTCNHGFWLHDCSICAKKHGECDYGSCTAPAEGRVGTRPMCSRHAEPQEWTISVCGGCNLPVEACRCEPDDWVSPSGEQLEPPSRPVRVVELPDAA